MSESIFQSSLNVTQNNMEIQRWNMCSDLETIIRALKREDYKDWARHNKIMLKEALNRFIEIEKLIEREQKIIQDQSNTPLPENLNIVEYHE